MKILLLATLLAMLPFSLRAEEKEALVDFILPVPVEFSQAAAKALTTRKMPLREYFLVQGIVFPEGSEIALNAEKHTLIGKLPHLEALHIIQILAVCTEDRSGKLSREIFDPNGPEGILHEGCFSPK